MIKLVVADLDGTLLDNDGNLDSELIDVVNKLREKGILFSLASGRNKEIMKDFVQTLNIEIPYMSDNGANVYQKDKCLKTYYFDKVYNNFILEVLAKYELPFNGYSTKSAYYNLESDKLNTVRNRLGDKIHHEVFTMKDFSKEEFYKITLDSIDNQNIEKAVEEITNNCPNIYMKKAEGTFFTITQKGVVKGKACLELSNILNIRPEEIMSMGDNNNDVPMFKVTGQSACVSNAKVEILLQASHCCGDNNDHGPARFLRKYFELW